MSDSDDDIEENELFQTLCETYPMDKVLGVHQSLRAEKAYDQFDDDYLLDIMQQNECDYDNAVIDLEGVIEQLEAADANDANDEDDSDGFMDGSDSEEEDESFDSESSNDVPSKSKGKKRPSRASGASKKRGKGENNQSGNASNDTNMKNSSDDDMEIDTSSNKILDLVNAISAKASKNNIGKEQHNHSQSMKALTGLNVILPEKKVPEHQNSIADNPTGAHSLGMPGAGVARKIAGEVGLNELVEQMQIADVDEDDSNAITQRGIIECVLLFSSVRGLMNANASRTRDGKSTANHLHDNQLIQQVVSSLSQLPLVYLTAANMKQDGVVILELLRMGDKMKVAARESDLFDKFADRKRFYREAFNMFWGRIQASSH